jgi:hypothetical protein
MSFIKGSAFFRRILIGLNGIRNGVGKHGAMWNRLGKVLNRVALFG